MKNLTPREFKTFVKNIKSKRNKGKNLTIYELYIEACDNYNQALSQDNNDKNYFEGKKNAYFEVLEILENQIKK